MCPWWNRADKIIKLGETSQSIDTEMQGSWNVEAGKFNISNLDALDSIKRFSCFNIVPFCIFACYIYYVAYKSLEVPLSQVCPNHNPDKTPYKKCSRTTIFLISLSLISLIRLISLVCLIPLALVSLISSLCIG